MHITLETVRQILKESLGFESFSAGFIKSVEESDQIPTAGISPDGNLIYNSAFVEKYIKSKEDLFSLVFHELLHPMFNHFIFKSGEIENLAADAVINAVISTLFSVESRSGNLFKQFYRPKGVEGLLRSESCLSRSRFEKTYQRLYRNNYNSSENITTGELITTLKVLLDTTEVTNVVLLGSHDSSSETSEGWPTETLEKLATDFKKATKENQSHLAGYNCNLMDLFMDALRTHISIKRQILQRMATNRKVDRFKELFQRKRITTSPIPIYPSKRDMVLLSAGFYPGFFHNRINSPTTKDQGLVIYLDVSGSVDEYLPKIISILRNLKNEISSIFLFSNKVVEVAFTTLLQGKIKTTGGTDFDCIAESILDRQFDKAIIITDGYASMKAENKKKLQSLKLKSLTILFERAQKCADFECFGDIVQLDDITH